MTHEDMNGAIGSAVRRLRHSRAISQDRLANLLKQRRERIQEIETGQHPLQPYDLWVLAQHFQFSISTFLDDALSDKASSPIKKAPPVRIDKRGH